MKRQFHHVCRNLYLALLIVSLLLLPFNAIASKGEDAEATVIFQHTEITDIETLAHRAFDRVSDIDADQHIQFQHNLHNENCDIPVNVYSTSQLLKKELYSDGTIVSSMATTFISFIDNETLLGESLRANGTNSKEKWDSSIGVKTYLTVYYKSTENTQGQEGFYINKVTGGWTITDSTLAVTNKKYSYASNGQNLNGPPNYISSQINSDVSVTGWSFSKNTGFSYYINSEAGMYYVQASTDCMISRGGSSWSLNLMVKVQ